jgi:hypothetical protein
LSVELQIIYSYPSHRDRAAMLQLKLTGHELVHKRQGLCIRGRHLAGNEQKRVKVEVGEKKTLAWSGMR